MIILVHWLMLVLFTGWGSYFVYVLLRFRRSRNAKADYRGVPIMPPATLRGCRRDRSRSPHRLRDSPLVDARQRHPPETDATVVRMVAEQFAWERPLPRAGRGVGKTDISLISPENPLGLDRNDPAAKDDIVTINQLNLPSGNPSSYT